MGEPISATSGILAILSFSFHAGKSLYTLIDTYRKHDFVVRDLRADLGGLTTVLDDLSQALVDADTIPESTTLKVPLFSCGQICKEFGTLIESCTRHSKDAGKSIRDWSALQLNADQINAFRVSLSGYKTTMLLSLGLENLRLAHITTKCMAEFRDMIEDARTDLMASLQRFELTPVAPADGEAYLAWITTTARAEEERNTILVCLRTCDEVWADLARQQRYVMHKLARNNPEEDVIAETASAFYSENLMTSTLDQCQATVGSTKRELQGRLKAIAGLPGNANVREQDSIQKCLTFCDHVMEQTTRVNVYEDFTTGEDSRQYMVSTVGELISAKRIDFGARSVLVSGQMSDDTVQIAFKTFGPDAVTASNGQASTTTTEPSFERYGRGHPLKPRGSKP